MKTSRWILWSALVSVLLAGPAAVAQERFSAITGTVVDESGAAMPGVTVTLTHLETKRVIVRTTDTNGNYAAREIEPGRYSIRCELAGFSTTEVADVNLLLGKTLKVPATLKVGTVTETVQVVGESPLIDIASTARGNNIPAEEFDNLPKGRSFESLAAAAPSVNTGQLEGGIQVNGASAGENNFTVDSVYVNSLVHGHQRQEAVFEHLQEVQVKTSGLSAEYGGALGGVISAVTKSGGNDFKGSVFYYYSGDSLVSTNGLDQRLVLDPVTQNNASTVQDTAQSFDRHDVGASLGGPIIRNKLYFFDVIDEAGAAQRILPVSRRKKTIGKNEVEDIIAKIARIPPQTVSSDDRTQLKNLERNLKNVVFGQDPAIEALSAAIKMARSGLGKPDKPIGSFLFSGPTGVGKTEVAKQLAFTLGIELIRFDMSEYMERHAVSRLIGAPPGYVGFDQGGLLTEAISKKPHAVLLMDEIEKAHPDIFNILLQVMDHGTLTDNNGRKADFRNVIVIMTTNAGAETLQKRSIGFANAREAGDEMADIKRMFTPEFRNRIDAIISFRGLDEEIILRVVDKFLMALEDQLHEKKVEITFSTALRGHLAKKGFDPVMGARPMARLIQDTIRKALADELLFGRLVGGGRVSVDVDEAGEIVLEFPGNASGTAPPPPQDETVMTE